MKDKKYLENSYSIFANYRSLKGKQEKRFVALPHSFINHKSFTSMKSTTKLLYLYMTDYSEGRQQFEFPRRINKNICSAETFKKAVKELQEHGFIEIINNGGLYKNATIYLFTSKWKEYITKSPIKRKTKLKEYKNK